MCYSLRGLNPLKRVNSILTELTELRKTQVKTQWSQSPQAGQFNSYQSIFIDSAKLTSCLNPLKRVNSILTGKDSVSPGKGN